MDQTILLDLLSNPWVLFSIIAWTLPWKGVALWKAVSNKNKGWFIIMLVMNTLAILEIIYIFVFSKKAEKPTQVINQ